VANGSADEDDVDEHEKHKENALKVLGHAPILR
jgi:hypothetical protein